MTLLDEYMAAVARKTIRDDPLQREVVGHLQRVTDELTVLTNSWFKEARRRMGLIKAPRGLYLYGPVGVGKTYLMDLFYQNVKALPKARFHFHHFMQHIDAQLRTLQGHRDPLRFIAREFAKTTRLLCLDEFLVNDVASAMILAELLQALFTHGVVIVATANTRPDDLYLNGVQRERFLPAIAFIKQHCETLLLTEEKDYRRGRAALPEAYFHPLTKHAEKSLAKQFDVLAGLIQPEQEICVQKRMISVVHYSLTAVWFEFDVICNMPRCQLDYLEIAARFETVFVSRIPILGVDDTIHVVLFIHFIDVMYDSGIRLVVSAAARPDELYPIGPLRGTFMRTLSRLEEMQSADYLLRHVRNSHV